MKKIFFVLALLTSLIFCNYSNAQEMSTGDFNDCVAIFFNDKMLVDEYSPEGKCSIDSKMKGKLTLHTVSLSETSAKAVKSVNFRIAIKNGKTKTIWIYSDQSFSEVQLQDIIKECNEGDSIIIMTEGKKYALPHNEISISWSN